MNDDDHHGVDIDNDNDFMDGLPHGETDPDGPMGGHGDSQALPTVLCAPEAAAPWVPVTSPIPGFTALPIGAQVMDFPLPTDVPILATHPPHGEIDPDGPMGGAGASEPIDGAEAIHTAPCADAAAAHRTLLVLPMVAKTIGFASLDIPTPVAQPRKGKNKGRPWKKTSSDLQVHPPLGPKHVTPLPADWDSKSKAAKKHWMKRHRGPGSHPLG
jgi:hypothetical protein